MTYRPPDLVELPDQVPGTVVWPELATSLGDEAVLVGPRESRWLTVATLHRSALYEDRVLSPIVSPRCLSLLENVGSTLLHLELLTSIDMRTPGASLSERSPVQAQLLPAARRHLAEVLGIAGHARLGAGERAGRAAASTLDKLTMQVLGWWSLLLPGAAIRGLVHRTHTILEGDVARDWRTLFHEAFARLDPHYTHARSGPDHATLFEATVRTRDGKSGVGSAPSKKQANQNACSDYLRHHAPALLASPTASRTTPLSAAPVTGEHRRVATQFDSCDAAPFSRALTHFSWVHENTREPDRRSSNEVLANVGSAVLGVLVARARALFLLATTTTPDPDLAVALTVPDEALVPLGHALGLPAASLVGRGQRQLGLATELVANLFQAVLAAAYSQSGTVDELERRLPDVVGGFLQREAPSSTRDAATRLQELAVELGIGVSTTDRRTGPDHATSFHNTTSITDGAATVVVEGTASGRTAAKKDAANAALAAAALSFGHPTDVDQPDVARFFLARHLETLSARPARWPAWRRRNVLGARDLADRDWTAFDRWALAVDRVGASTPTPQVLDGLAAYYRSADRTAGTRPLFASALTQVLRWIGGSADDDRAILDRERWEDLVALTAAHSIWLTTGDAADLTGVLRAWARPERRRVPVHLEVTGTAGVSPRAAAAVVRVLQECREASSGVRDELPVTLIPSATGHEIHLPALPDGGSRSLIALACEAAPEVTRYEDEDGMTLRIGALTPRPGWPWEAALRPVPTDEDDVELARVLHDLKNEVTAARAALGRATTTRTERREADLDASRHLDAAEALAARLVDAEYLYQAAPTGSCDVASFLRSYCSDLIDRLPPGVRVIPPVMSPATVALGAAILRAALDNLVKNAAEAMGARGEIEFEYTSDDADGIVLLEVRDTGPGLPENVVDALHAGGPAPSSKRYGSGLGLPGVTRMLRRAGGELLPVRAHNGATWLLTLPLDGASDA